MKKLLLLLPFTLLAGSAKAWWDGGHLVTAMIAYLHLEDEARQAVDQLTAKLESDYPYVNHFSATGPWPDDLKAEGVSAFNTWHYTNQRPIVRDNVAIPDQPLVDILWAIGEARDILADERPRPVDKARFLGFLSHFVGDLHQPLHSTSVHNNEQPGGNAGGNGFRLEGRYRNLHMVWDDAGGLLAELDDINPFGTEKDALTQEELDRIAAVARRLMAQHPRAALPEAANLDPDFWALESSKLAERYGYFGTNSVDNRGRRQVLRPGDTPSQTYLEEVQRISARQLALGGYRLAGLLNELFAPQNTARNTSETEAHLAGALQTLFDAIAARDEAMAESVLLPDALFHSLRDGGRSVGSQTAKDFLKGFRRGRDQWLERFWNPAFDIRGQVATLTAPYDFHRNGRFSHCGTDIVNFIQTPDGWKISSITYDVVTEGCPTSPLGKPE